MELTQTIKELREIAPRLNELADDAKDAFHQLDVFLRRTKIGCFCSVTDDDHVETVSWQRLDGDPQITIGGKPYGECDRMSVIGAVDLLPRLVAAIAGEAGRGLRLANAVPEISNTIREALDYAIDRSTTAGS